MKKIIFSVVCFVSLFVSAVFGLGVSANNASNFQQLFYADTNYITASNLMFYNDSTVDVEPKLLNITSLDPNTSRVLGYDVSYQLDTEGRFSFGYYLDLEHCYFDLTYAENQPLYMSVFMTHHGEEFNTRNDYYRMYYTEDKSTLSSVLSNFHAGIDDGTLYSKDVGPVRYYASCFDLSGLDLTKGYLMFLARKDYIVDSQVEYDLTMKYSINMVCSRYFESYGGSSTFVTSCINWLDYAGFDVYNYYDLTSNFISRDVYAWYGLPEKVPNLFGDVNFVNSNPNVNDTIPANSDYFSANTLRLGDYMSDKNIVAESTAMTTQVFFSNPINSRSSSFQIRVTNGQFLFKDNQNVMVLFNGDKFSTNFILVSGSSRGEGLWRFVPSTDLEYIYGIIISWNTGAWDDHLPLEISLNTTDYGLGYDSGFTEGVDKGYDNGYQDGILIGNDKGFTDGYNKGFNDGYASVLKDDNTLVGMIYAIVDAPFNVLKDSMNFNFLGINVADFIFSALTMIVVIKIFKFIFGR